MAELTELTAPESTVDAALAVRTGQARLRRRRLGAVGTAMAVVLAGSAVLSLRPGDTPVPLAPAVTGSPSPSASPSASTGLPVPSGGPVAVTAAPLTGKDPLTVDADFGWLPEEMNSVSYMLNPYRTEVHAQSADRFASILQLRVFGEGETPDPAKAPPGAMGVKQDLAPIKGGQAFMVAIPGDGTNGTLYWKASSGHWIELNFLYLAPGTRDQVVRKVAENVVTGRREVPLPAVFTGVPKGYTLSSGTFERETVDGKKWWSLNLNYASGPAAYFATTVTPDGERPRSQGLPSPLRGARTQEPLACRTENGSKVCVTAEQKQSFAEVGGPEAWLDRIRLLGTDETRWTTEVLP